MLVHRGTGHLFSPGRGALPAEERGKNLDGNDRDGYWWLAFDYTNFRFAGNVPNRKKGGWFPLHKDSRCSQFGCRCEESEAYYLLDPIKKTDTELIASTKKATRFPLRTPIRGMLSVSKNRSNV